MKLSHTIITLIIGSILLLVGFVFLAFPVISEEKKYVPANNKVIQIFDENGTLLIESNAKRVLWPEGADRVVVKTIDTQEDNNKTQENIVDKFSETYFILARFGGPIFTLTGLFVIGVGLRSWMFKKMSKKYMRSHGFYVGDEQGELKNNKFPKQRNYSFTIKLILISSSTIIITIVLLAFMLDSGLNVDIIERNEGSGSYSANRGMEVMNVRINSHFNSLENVTIQFVGKGHQIQSIGDMGPFSSVLITPDADHMNFEKIIVEANDGDIRIIKNRN